MALTKEKKKKSLDSLSQKIAGQKSLVFVDFSKVNSKDLFAFRRKLKETGCELKVGKKTLIRIALGQKGISFWGKIKANVPGQLALVLGITDEVAPARLSHQFAKTNENFKILGGIFEHRFVGKEHVLALAVLPSREELLAKMVGSIASPISGFEHVLIGNTRSLVSILSQIKK